MDIQDDVPTAANVTEEQVRAANEAEVADLARKIRDKLALGGHIAKEAKAEELGLTEIVESVRDSANTAAIRTIADTLLQTASMLCREANSFLGMVNIPVRYGVGALASTQKVDAAAMQAAMDSVGKGANKGKNGDPGIRVVR